MTKDKKLARDVLYGLLQKVNVKIEDLKGIIAQLSMLTNIAETIDALFKDSEHHDLWVAKHA